MKVLAVLLLALLLLSGCALFTPDPETGRTPFYEGVSAGYEAAQEKIKDDPTPFAGLGDLLDYVITAAIAGSGAGYLAYRRGRTVERKNGRSDVPGANGGSLAGRDPAN